MIVAALINSFFLAVSTPLLIVPPSWKSLDNTSEKMPIVLMKKEKKGFVPSINVTIEPTSVSMKEYLREAKHLALLEHHTWRHLGSLSSLAGKGALVEIDLETAAGPVRILQYILLSNETAYLITAACLKADFGSLQETFTNTFSSFSLH